MKMVRLSDKCALLDRFHGRVTLLRIVDVNHDVRKKNVTELGSGIQISHLAENLLESRSSTRVTTSGLVQCFSWPNLKFEYPTPLHQNP
ncbi:MAG: hypothetical protein JWM11_1671 [Planctomycetaceae bacterium]|nr:hypothetical protein [Planctomycetaceae bacterium]